LVESRPVKVHQVMALPGRIELVPWRRLLQRLNWRPTIDVDVERYAIEQEIKQLDEINAKLSAILSSSGTSSTPPPSTPDESEM